MASKKQKHPGQVEFVAWIPDHGDEDDGEHLFEFSDYPSHVAEHFAEMYDSEMLEYPDERVVHVKNLASGELKAFTVYSEPSRTYTSREKIDLAFTDPHGEHGISNE